MKKLLLFVVAILLLSSCKQTRYIPVETTIRDTLRITKIQRDSIYCRDSVYVDKWRAGDTVFVEKTVTRIKYNTVWRNDTIYRSIDNDSVNANAAKALSDLTEENNENLLKLKQNKKTIFSLSLVIVLLSCVLLVLLKRKQT